MTDKIRIGDHVLVFDGLLWKGRDIGDNSQFWKPATILDVYRYGSCWTGEWVADVKFDHRPDKVSQAHFCKTLRRLND